MTNSLNFWRVVLQRLEQNKASMILIVAESSGSSPGRQGFKMVVGDSELFGSIGGGLMEVELVELARESKVPEIVEQVHRKNSPNSSGMICSGEQTVLLFNLKSEDFKTISSIIFALENSKPKKLKISNRGISVVDREDSDPDYRFENDSQGEYLYEETLGYKNKLFVVGGGHCALALSELMSKLDFHITLFDDRPDLNTIAKNEFVQKKIILESYEKIGDHVSSGGNHYVVVMTLGYKFDELVIRKLFEKDFKYFGVLGSRAKMAVLLGGLEKDGFDKDRIANIRTPIGVEINSQTPEEIAVSIAAEIIAVKNAKG